MSVGRAVEVDLGNEPCEFVCFKPGLDSVAFLAGGTRIADRDAAETEDEKLGLLTLAADEEEMEDEKLGRAVAFEDEAETDAEKLGLVDEPETEAEKLVLGTAVADLAVTRL